MADIKIDYVKLQNAVASLENETNKLRELFSKQDNNFKLLEDNQMWNGTSNQSCLLKYKEVSGKYEDILSSLDKFKNFLFNVGEAYKAINETANGDVLSSNN